MKGKRSWHTAESLVAECLVVAALFVVIAVVVGGCAVQPVPGRLSVLSWSSPPPAESSRSSEPVVPLQASPLPPALPPAAASERPQGS